MGLLRRRRKDDEADAPWVHGSGKRDLASLIESHSLPPEAKVARPRGYRARAARDVDDRDVDDPGS